MTNGLVLNELKSHLTKVIQDLILYKGDPNWNGVPKAIYDNNFNSQYKVPYIQKAARLLWEGILNECLDYLNREGVPDQENYDFSLVAHQTGKSKNGNPELLVLTTNSQEESRYHKDYLTFNLKQKEREDLFYEYLPIILKSVVYG